jgi:hypothetical protein
VSTRTEATRSPAADVLAAQPHPARGEACAGLRAVYVATAGRVPNTASVLISRLYSTGTVAGSTAFVFDDRRFLVSPHGVGVLFRLALGAKSELSLVTEHTRGGPGVRIEPPYDRKGWTERSNSGIVPINGPSRAVSEKAGCE